MERMMIDGKKVVLASIVFTLFFVVPSFATTYYVRTDGGSATQCSGTTDAPYPGSGSGQACAFSHPFWAISVIGNNPTKMVGGDTLIIDGSNNAQYMMGYGGPNVPDTSKCGQFWPWDCYMRNIPSGPDPSHPTRILGKGYDTGCTNPPQLWGTERAKQIINLQGSSNVELQCLDVTDHSDCQDGGPKACNRSSVPYGPWAQMGLAAADSSNVLLKNVNIHGLAKTGIYAGRLKDWTLQNSKIVANSFVGWDGDIGAGASSNSGTIMFDHVTVAYNGCGETYPGKTPFNCYSQDQGGYGDGLGTQQTGGNWVVVNSDFSHNVSDGLDLLYHDGNGSITIKRSRFEGNAGNQVKTHANTVIENSIIVGNCAYFSGKSFTWNSSTFNNCRAAGNPLAIFFRGGMSASISGTTITSNGDTTVLSGGDGCGGSEKILSRDNIFLGGPEYNSPGDLSTLYFASGATGNGDGTCGSLKMDDDYSVIWGTRGISTDCSGKAHSLCQDPKFMEPAVNFYGGTAFNVGLQSGSPARDKGTILSGMSSLDYNEFNRGATWDIGALEFGSVPSSGSSSAVCGNRVIESGEQCDDGNTNSGDGCSSTCQTEVTPVNGVCGSSNNSCTSGALNDATDTSTNYLWSCVGSNGGSTASCSLAKPLNGVCGSSNNTCTTGTLSDTSDSSTNYLWTCLGVNGGVSASCSLPKALNGACGTTNNSCTSGSLSDTSDSSTDYLWSCVGGNGGTTASCSLAKAMDGLCGTSNNACIVGTLGDVADTSSNYLWNCLGLNGGLTATCSLAKSVNGVCGATNNNCVSGTLNDTADNTTNYLWSCVGSNGGSTVSCSLPKAPVCGNGVVEGSEQCDDGNTTSGDGCSNVCAAEGPVCGNGVKEGTEICDDGNLVSNDGCSSSCRAEYCGDGIKQSNEQCDDGNWVNRDGCSALCVLETSTCGNGVIEGNEQCDDGNKVNGDGCSSNCSVEKLAVCGNGTLEGTEQCDDGNTVSGDGCSSTCAKEIPVCGNGKVEGTEQCDDGNLVSGDGCSSVCIRENQVCGNGVKEGTEICDDGNLVSNDGCSSTCRAEYCGDGIKQTVEQCDDGNWVNRDGCSAICKIEKNTCGNGILEGNEECDDGNKRSGDGCSKSCSLETTLNRLSSRK
jgi:cysteine-rich repeat protein